MFKLPFLKRGVALSLLSLLLLLFAVSSLLAGCGNPIDTIFPTDSPTPTPQNNLQDPIVSSYQPNREAQICMNGTQSYSQQYVGDSLNYIKGWLKQATTVNQGGMTVYYTLVDGRNTLASQNTTSFVIPSFPPDQMTPGLTPTPTVDPNRPYGNTDKINAVATTNARNSKAWQTVLSNQHAALREKHGEVDSWMNDVRAMSSKPVHATADLLNCVFLANRIFGDSQHSQHILLLISSLPEYVPSNYDNVDPIDLALPGDTIVYILWRSCDQITAEVCDEAREQWGDLFTQEGVRAANIHILSPNQSHLQENPFLVNG